MHKANIIALTLLATAGTLVAAAAAAGAAPSGPTPARYFIDCKPGYTDIGNGQGEPMCVLPDNQFCPGTWTDHDGDGNIMWDYGECYYTGGELYPTPPGGTPTTAPAPTAAPTPPPTDPPTTPAPAPAPMDPPTTPAPTSPPTEPPTTPAPTSPPSATSPATAPATAAPTTTEPLPLSDPIVTITSTEVACDGMIHVEYETAANPAPADEVSHLIVFNPTSNDVDFHVAEFTDREPHGAYTFEQQGSVDDSYRVVVTVLFDPENPDEVAVSDWAMATVADGC